MSLAKLTGKALPLSAPRLAAAVLVGVGVVLLPGLPLAGVLALAAGLILARPPRPVWVAGLPALFLLGVAGILQSGQPLAELVLPLAALAGGLVVLAVAGWLGEERRWRAALDAFAQRELAALQPEAVADRKDTGSARPHAERVRRAVGSRA